MFMPYPLLRSYILLHTGNTWGPFHIELVHIRIKSAAEYLQSCDPFIDMKCVRQTSMNGFLHTYLIWGPTFEAFITEIGYTYRI
jgi:hypothetical protein